MPGQRDVVLGMSGGVDSAAAALLLQEQGYRVVGATLRMHEDNTKAAERAARDVADAAAVCAQLDIEHRVIDCRAAFRTRVLERFAREYDAGLTPNPCVFCNPGVKFAALFRLADELDCSFVATGHYARVGRNEESGRHCLYRAESLAKDQSYVLYTLTQAQLARLLLPLWNREKPEIRKMAADAELRLSQKLDSQDICFVPDGDYGAFLREFTGHDGKPGRFLDADGQPLGAHRGVRHYTIGQRKGLGISFGQPMFVQCVDAQTGDITLTDEAALFSDTLTAADIHWQDREPPVEPVRLCAKIRYSHRGADATIYPGADGRVRVVFDAPQRAVTPGQSVVFYDGNRLAGGAVIEPPEQGK